MVLNAFVSHFMNSKCFVKISRTKQRSLWSINDRTVAPLRIVKEEEKKSFLEKREILFPLPFLFQNIISLT